MNAIKISIVQSHLLSVTWSPLPAQNLVHFILKNHFTLFHFSWISCSASTYSHVIILLATKVLAHYYKFPFPDQRLLWVKVNIVPMYIEPTSSDKFTRFA